MIFYDNNILSQDKVKYCNAKAEELIESNSLDALEYAKEALKISESLSLSQEKTKAIVNIAWANYYLDNYDEALKHALSMINTLDKSKDIVEYSSVTLLVGHVYRKTGIFDLALEYYFKAIKLYEQMIDKYNIAYIYRSIAIVYTNMKNLKKALEYALRALKDFEELKSEKGMATASLAAGDIYREMNDKDNGILYNCKALVLYSKHSDELGIAYSYINLADICFNHDCIAESIKYYDLSLKICKKINNRFGVVHIYYYLAKLFIKTSEYTSAEEYMRLGLRLAKSIKSKYLVADFYMLYSDYYSGNKKYRKALKYYKLYSSVKESMISDKYEQRINKIQVEYDLYKKEKEIELYKLKEVRLRKANEELEKANKTIKKQNIRLTDMSEKFKEISKTDDLTRLYNRRGFKEIISQLKESECTNSQYTLVLCDIDDFKKVNDQYGHLFGDIILEKLSDVLKESLTQSDYIARWGGEEILILLNKENTESQYEVNKLRKTIEEIEFFYNDEKVIITMTFGISEYKNDDFQECITKADKAMYYGKNHGKNCVVFIADTSDGYNYHVIRD